MNDEIKEILGILRRCTYGNEVYLIKEHGATLLLDYITNLQQENERLKELNENTSKVCMAEHRYGVDKAEETRDYKSRIEKAVEYMNNTFNIISIKDMFDIMNKLEDILNGRSEE